MLDYNKCIKLQRNNNRIIAIGRQGVAPARSDSEKNIWVALYQHSKNRDLALFLFEINSQIQVDQFD